MCFFNKKQEEKRIQKEKWVSEKRSNFLLNNRVPRKVLGKSIFDLKIMRVVGNDERKINAMFSVYTDMKRRKNESVEEFVERNYVGDSLFGTYGFTDFATVTFLDATKFAVEYQPDIVIFHDLLNKGLSEEVEEWLTRFIKCIRQLDKKIILVMFLIKKPEEFLEIKEQVEAMGIDLVLEDFCGKNIFRSVAVDLIKKHDCARFFMGINDLAEGKEYDPYIEQYMKQARKMVSSAQCSPNKIIWQNRTVKIKHDSQTMKVRVKGTQETFNMGVDVSEKALSMTPMIGNFYVSNYLCPDCKLPMYKTNFFVGKEMKIKINNGDIHAMKRIFTCRDCLVFYTAKYDLLSDGEVYVTEFDKISAYEEYFQELSSKGTTQGRAD